MGCFMVWGVMFHRGLFHGVGCYVPSWVVSWCGVLCSIVGCFMVWGVMFHRGLFHGVGCYSDIGILQHLETIYFCIPVLRDVY